ncbi:MAG: RagB/SusD family nutrient uptake outer membrane protein [Flavobacteriaceae bacterium]
MKSSKILILLCCSLCWTCSDDFLEVIPRGVTVPISLSDFQGLMNQGRPLNHAGMYNVTFGNDDFYITSDRFEARESAAIIGVYRSYFWEDQLYNIIDDYTDDPDWSYMYNNIYITNYVLSKIDDARLDGDSESDRANIKGQALMRRAYAYFMLANLYGKHYTPQGAATDLAVPLFTDVPDPIRLRGKLSRATVAEVYAQVEADLTQAIELLPDYPFLFPLKNYRPSKMSAYALKARVHLYKGEWPAALAAAEASYDLIQANANVELRHIEDHYGDWSRWSRSTYFNPEAIWGIVNSGFPRDFEGSDLAQSVNNDGTTIINTPGFRLSDELVALIDLENDIRVGVTIRSPDPDDPGTIVVIPKGIYASSLGEGYELSLAASTPQDIFPTMLLSTLIGVGDASELDHHGQSLGGLFTPIPFTVGNVLLMLAEAHTRVGNLSEAEHFLETLRIERILNYTHTPSPDAQSLLEEIINERRIELMGTGLRWFDIKRLNVEGWDISIRHPLTRLDGTEEVHELFPGSNRFVLQIPQRIIIEFQPGLEQNE